MCIFEGGVYRLVSTAGWQEARGRREFVNAMAPGAAAKLFAEAGATGFTIIEDCQTGQRTAWCCVSLELHYATCERMPDDAPVSYGPTEGA